MAKPLILFGAGASYGSEEGGTPPLGRKLFDALREASPDTWGQISATAADRFRDDFEKGMEEYAESHASDGTVDKLQRAMAAFFFNFRPGPTSLYVKFARWMSRARWNGAVASLNYERLLELAVRGVGLNVVIGAPSPNAIELCLPHGCCNLFINMRGQGIVLGSMNLKLDSAGPPEAVDDPSEFQERIQNDGFPPVMCNIQPDKWIRSGGSFIDEQRRRFASMVNSATVVAIVGIKVQEHDDHIWAPLAATRARVVYCAGESGASDFNSWAGNYGRKGDRAIRTLWDEGFDEICEALMT